MGIQGLFHLCGIQYLIARCFDEEKKINYKVKDSVILVLKSNTYILLENIETNKNKNHTYIY
jgi:hypothetical protein